MNSQQSLLNQQLMGKKQTLQRQIMEQKQQLLLQQQMLVDVVKLSPNFFLHVPMGLTGNSLLPISIYCPFLCAYFGDSNKGVLTIREANSIQKLKCYGEKKQSLIYQLLDS